jgi:hypothetical protein
VNVRGEPHGTRQSGRLSGGHNSNPEEALMKVKTSVKAGSAVWGS